MDQSHQRASAFVHRLLSNQALKSYTPLQKEEQVNQFLTGNIQQLGPTLMSQSFFPGMSLDQILDLLLATLRKLTNERLIPAIKGIVQRIDYSFIQSIRQEAIRPSTVQEQILRVLDQALAKPAFRQMFSSSYTALHYDFVNRYLSESYRLQRHIHVELTKVQRLNMSKDDIKAYVEVIVLLKSLAHAHVASADKEDSRSGLINTAFQVPIGKKMSLELTQLPPQVISNIITANISIFDNPQIETTARLAAVLCARGKSFTTNVRIDRGAETPDKSWLSIARRNHKFYGFDIKILDEFYLIAAENGW